jgi:magnesium transporter
MINCEFVNGAPHPLDFKPEELGRYLSNAEGVVWLDIEAPTEDDIGLLESVFHFHPLAIEDVRKGGQRARVVEYDKYVFVVMHELEPDPDGSLDDPCIRHSAEVHAFVGNNFCITVHREHSAAIDTARKRWNSTTDLQHQGPYALLYLLLDSVVDDYFPAIDAFDERIDLLEQHVIKPAREDVRTPEQKWRNSDGPVDVLNALITLRRSLLETRRYVAPLRDAVNVLLRRAEAMQVGGSDDDKQRADRAKVLFTYYQDVYDHTIRIVDTVDTYRDLLAGTLDAHLAVASNRLNEIVKVLTSVSIILMTWAGITSLYGMNFAHMPELHWKYGYVYVWGLMIVSGVAEWIYFRRRKWI